MKRVVAITVVAVVVTSLFSFSAFAESPVQPLQVVTYSDTSTQLRISGTAERLHYNVDSFQVVFTNPPNNYGTACTPVLVSFRFYNSSDLPAYVGQAEFEIVCTNGTGSTNLIIYGYDQISTDLFVAESSYSTSEVGRIGIGASNDFAYYTGFVVPPKTSLYFSAIVYVNASAYEGVANVTGSQEQVNQLTMSSLNLYTNQISFSDAYPYHNQPIDFSEIIQSISSLSTVVSTSTQMQDIIDILTYTGSNPSLSLPNGRYDEYTYTKNNLSIRISRFVGKPTVINYDFEANGANDTLLQYATVRYPILISLFNIVNDTRGQIVTSHFNVSNVLPLNGSCYLNSYGSPIFDLYAYDNSSLHLYFKLKYDSWRSLVPYEQCCSFYVFYVEVPYSEALQFANMNFAGFSDPYPLATNDYVPLDEYHILKDLYSSLVKDSASDNTEEAQDMNDEIHDQEQIWYDNNSDALEAVGLSNYRFSPSQSSGITQAVTQFQAVWNALGQWTNVYIFILILSISTYIIRHEPTTRVKQYRSSVQAERAERISYYGKKNAEARASSSGSTLKNAIRRRK